ncbi:50S ribosomal protein L25/general stress protein Ctc [Ferrovum sp.]|uniref:50S ribosomal protein L25/general stress protein Ctc n=1 Tax=Ferrovum sp. TaxID=2609467 RepID=UPI002611A26F|nr:50S ribosomal protein L25/general stress protein Ctc [Ferrovum sp.]
MEITITHRTAQGTGASRRLRRAGRVPGILYGDNQEALVIEFDHNELFHKLRQEAFHSSVISLDLDGKSHPALLRDVQRHPFKALVLHVDFQRVDLNRKVHTKVPLHFINGDNSPGVKQSGAIISHILTEIEVLCLPGDLPEYIEVDLHELTVAHPFHVADLKAPAGIEFAALHKGENPAVVAAVLPRAARAEEDLAPTTVSVADVPAISQKAPADAAKGGKK